MEHDGDSIEAMIETTQEVVEEVFEYSFDDISVNMINGDNSEIASFLPNLSPDT